MTRGRYGASVGKVMREPSPAMYWVVSPVGMGKYVEAATEVSSLPSKALCKSVWELSVPAMLPQLAATSKPMATTLPAPVFV